MNRWQLRQMTKQRRAGGTGATGPTISGVSATLITGTSVRISWDVSTPSTGQVAYGLTGGYGSLSALESGYLSHHVQDITGLTVGQTYHFTPHSYDTLGNPEVNGGTDYTFQTTPPTTGYWGPIFNSSKNNVRTASGADADMTSYRFRASRSGAITKVRSVFRTGSGYSLGNGGTYKVSIQSDDGTGKPSGTILGANGAFATFSPGNPGGLEQRPDLTLGTPATVVSGTLYHVVFDNTAASEASNYASMNNTYEFDTFTPRQLTVSDDYALLRRIGSTWGSPTKDFPTLDLTYSDGSHDGYAYTQSQPSMYALVTSTNWVRQRVTSTTGSHNAVAVHVRFGRVSGTGLITVSLKTSGGTLIEAVTTPATSFAVYGTPPLDDFRSSGTVVRMPFLSSHLLLDATEYIIEAKAAASTSVVSIPVAWQYFEATGPAVSFSSNAFREGTGEKSSNSGGAWATLGSVSPVHQFVIETG